MKKLIDDLRLIYKCCSLYYEEQKGQQEICESLGVSRPSVSRMLKSGKELGIVRIEVINPQGRTQGILEKQLEQAFGLKEAMVVSTGATTPGNGTVGAALGSTALAYLARVLHGGDCVGISMGLTLRQVAQAPCNTLEPVHCTFVPLVGGIGEGVDTHANFLAGEFARRFGGERLQLYSPAIFTDPAVLQGFRREEAVRHVFEMYEHLDTVVFGIGTLDNSQSTAVRLRYVDRTTLAAFSKAGAVGDISLQYYDKDGNTEPYRAYNERVAGLQLPAFKKITRRIAIAGGAYKAQAVLGALQGGFINVLLTDETCAQELLRLKNHAHLRERQGKTWKQ